MEQQNPEKVLVYKIIVFRAGSTNSRILEQDTSHWQPICYEATLIFKISLSQVYSEAGSLGKMKVIMKVL